MASYAEVMKALAAIYRASDETVRGALRGRVQNLQKFGVPIDVGAQTGRGRKIDYGREEIYQMMFCLELYEIGLPPVHAVQIVRECWRSVLADEFKKEWQQPSGNDRIAIVETNLLSGSWRQEYQNALKNNPQVVVGTAITLTSLKGIGSLFEKRKIGHWRHCALVNISALVLAVESEMAGALPAATTKPKKPSAADREARR
ncbi:MAG: hypothetical protein FD148_784 [Methylocystaceae bacterium]|nr:MAG: hypothetical protein FD148_784 [Methylocystaceae bacterium]